MFDLYWSTETTAETNAGLRELILLKLKARHYNSSLE